MSIIIYIMWLQNIDCFGVGSAGIYETESIFISFSLLERIKGGTSRVLRKWRYKLEI